MELRSKTPDAWLDVVFADFDTFLADHASCEKKASGMALSIAAHYPDQPRLLRAMADLAVEELTHYRDTVRLLIDRAAVPTADTKDPYIHAMNALVRRGQDVYLHDRLLVGALVERRGNERFGMIAAAVEANELQRFYQRIATSEANHWQLFLKLAGRYDEAYLDHLLDREAEIVSALPLTAALH